VSQVLPMRRAVWGVGRCLRQRLQEAETALERARSAPKPASVAEMLPRLREMIRRQVREIEKLAALEPVRARAAVRQALEAEEIVLHPAEHGRGVVAHFGLVPVQVATGTVSESVAMGACYRDWKWPAWKSNCARF